MYYVMDVNGKSKEELEKELIYFKKKIEMPVDSLDMRYEQKQYKAYIKKIKKALNNKEA